MARSLDELCCPTSGFAATEEEARQYAMAVIRDMGGIEDDVVVTKDGCRVLTDGVPKTVADIEALMAE